MSGIPPEYSFTTGNWFSMLHDFDCACYSRRGPWLSPHRNTQCHSLFLDDQRMQSETNRTVLLTLAFLVFSVNCFVFANFFDADRQGYIDTQRGIDQYNQLRQHVGLQGNLNVLDLPVIRFFQIIATCVLLIGLFFTNGITVEGLALYLVWPYSAFLATKLKQEFILFPLAFISLRSNLRSELLVSGGIGLVSYLASENNGVIIVAFRLLFFAMVRLTHVRAVLLMTVGIAVSILVDLYFDWVSGLLVAVAKYSHTRNTVNLEYSIAESVGILLTTLHLGINPPTDYWFNLPFSACALLLAWVGFRDLNSTERFLWFRSLMAFVVVYLACTSVTHAFQNTRYYYFLLPAMFPRFEGRLFVGLLSISLLHTFTALYIYEWVR